ncbi:MAG: hypothetical protein KJ072_03595 [Verrucomicrobia bacterium]|nr:hypothetical protein [Verrucomicrobiota bacterium]
MNTETLIRGLNEDLAAELGTVIRYTYQAAKCYGLQAAELPDTRPWRGFPHPKRRSRGPLQVEFLVQAGTVLLSATVTAR